MLNADASPWRLARRLHVVTRLSRAVRLSFTTGSRALRAHGGVRASRVSTVSEVSSMIRRLLLSAAISFGPIALAPVVASAGVITSKSAIGYQSRPTKVHHRCHQHCWHDHHGHHRCKWVCPHHHH